MRAFITTFALGAGALALAACSNQGASDTGDKTSVLAGRVDAGPVNYEVQTLAEGLDHTPFPPCPESTPGKILN